MAVAVRSGNVTGAVIGATWPAVHRLAKGGLQPSDPRSPTPELLGA
jgi:hypothetical protein